MDLALPLIGLGVVIVVAALLPWRRLAELVRGRRHRPANGVELPVEPPSFSVVALGLEGAGKTVLLASMFHELSTLPPIPPGRRDADRNPARHRRYSSLGPAASSRTSIWRTCTPR